MNNEKVQYLFRKPAKRIRNGDDKMSTVIIGKITSSTEDEIQWNTLPLPESGALRYQEPA